MLVNVHAYGILAAYTPVHAPAPGGRRRCFNTYIESFERVWASARAPERATWRGCHGARPGTASTKARTDYWDDPGAPSPTSRKPSASVIVRNSAGRPAAAAPRGYRAVDHPDRRAEEERDPDRVRHPRMPRGDRPGGRAHRAGRGLQRSPAIATALRLTARSACRSTSASPARPVSGELTHRLNESTRGRLGPRREDLDDYDIHPAILRRISHALHGTGPHVD